MSKENSSSSGIGFTGLLTIVLITLKLCKVIDWSWWWVTAPMWGHFIVAILIIISALVVSHYQDKRRLKNLKERIGMPKQKSGFQQRMDEYMEKRRSL